MVKQPSNSGKAWTPKQVSDMKSLAKHNTPTRLIGYKMGRSPASIKNKAQELGVSLKPTNKSTYGTKKK